MCTLVKEAPSFLIQRYIEFSILSMLWTLVIESLSWIELERLNEEAAIRKTVKQLRINDKALVKEARTLVYETVRRQNSIDFLINEALESDSFVKLKIGLRSFLRLYTYLVHYGGESLTRAYELIDHTIALLGLRDFRDSTLTR